MPAGTLRQSVEDTFQKVMGKAPRAPIPASDGSAEANTRLPQPLRQRAERPALWLNIAVAHCRAVIAGPRFEKLLHRAALQALGGIPST